MAGIVPVAAAPKPRAVAVAWVTEPQAQSMAPVAPATIATLFTLGVKVIVLPWAAVGRPVDAPPLVTVIAYGEAVPIAMLATYLD